MRMVSAIKRLLTILGISGLCVSEIILFAHPAMASNNLFDSFLTRKPPQDVRVLATEQRGDVEIEHILFYSRTAQTNLNPVRSDISAVVMRPNVRGRRPGLLLLHGGGGSAQEDLAFDWAKRGFVVLAPDLPGIGNPEKIKNGSGTWKQTKYGVNHFQVDSDATSSDIFDGVLAALQALYLLRSLPDVDPHRIGVTGVSWGGYATIMVAGLAGKDVSAAYSIYGSGNYDLGSAFQEKLANLSKEKAELWLRQLDARNYASGISAHFFEAAAANDNFFWIPAVTATLAEIHSSKNLVFAPNSNHWMDIPGGCEHTKEGVPHDNGWMSMQTVFFEYELMGMGSPFPRVLDDSATPSGEHEQLVRFHVEDAVGLVQAAVYTSQPGTPWKTRKWIPVKAELKDKWYTAQIPTGADWMALATDGRPVTVSSGVHMNSGVLERATQ